jgi:hypothetical protein
MCCFSYELSPETSLRLTHHIVKYYQDSVSWLKNLCLVITFFFNCCAGDTLWHLENFLQYIKYIILEFTPSIILLYPPSHHFL